MNLEEKSNKAWELFRQYIDANGKRKTPEREITVRTIAEFRSHFNIEELFNAIQAKKMRITIATVYNTIRELEAAGLVHKLLVNKAARYEFVLNTRDEFYLICSTCGKITGFSDAELLTVLSGYRPKRFNVQHVSLVFQGTCNSCQSKKKK